MIVNKEDLKRNLDTWCHDQYGFRFRQAGMYCLTALACAETIAQALQKERTEHFEDDTVSEDQK